jgi:hypothetical protein
LKKPATPLKAGHRPPRDDRGHENSTANQTRDSTSIDMASRYIFEKAAAAERRGSGGSNRPSRRGMRRSGEFFELDDDHYQGPFHAVLVYAILVLLLNSV